MWRRRREAASTRLSAAPYSAHHKLYSEAVVSSIASAVALAEVGLFRETVQYVQKAAKALYEGAREVFEQMEVSLQRLAELFVEAVTRVLAWVDEHKAYLFLMAAGVVALGVALNMWGLVELEKLAYAASLTPFVAGLADAGGKAAERFKTLAERWKVNDNEEQMIENIINEIINAPLKGERPFLKLSESANLPKPLVELRRALKRAEDMAKIDEVVKDAAVVAAIVLYKTLINNAKAYEEWAGWYEWARGLVKEREFTVKAEEVKRLHEAQRRLEEAAEEVMRELNSVLALYKSHSRELYEKLKPHLEVDVKKAEELAEASYRRLSDYSGANMGTKAYAALLSVARGGIYGHVAMLLAGEGALADIVLSTPEGVYQKAWRIAKGRGEAVDPSRSPKGAANWEDRAASAPLRYLLSRAVDEDLLFRRVEGGFEVFKAYGGVEARVDVLKIGETSARSRAGEEALRRFVEEAKRTALDLSGMDKAPQYLEWRATDVSTSGMQIVAATVHPWQLKWYFSLLGEEKSISGRADVTKKGIKLAVTALWPRERESQILWESRWLESLLGRRVESWRELVDAIDWSWVLRKVGELADKLKPWIGRKDASDAEREDLMRRMLGELALLVHFAETRRGKNDGDWREERIKMLAKAVEDLSGWRIAGDHAERLARAIIRYAEGYKKETEERIENLVRDDGVSGEEVWGIVERVLSGDDPYVYCLARYCARDEVVRKFVAPALELVMLDKALSGKFSREEALLRFGEMYATAIAGDGSVEPGKVMLTVGGELSGGAALLRLAALHLLNQLLPDELKFNVRIYVERVRYNIAATGENAARFMRLLAVSAPSSGGEYLSEKFNEFVKEAKVKVRFGNIRLTDGGNVAADLIISEGGVAVKYNVYLRKDAIVLQFTSSDQSRVELAARLLKLVGVTAEVQKEGGRDVWYIQVTTSMLATGHEELRNALAEIVREAIARGWVDVGKAEGWLEELEKGRVLKEGWPRYEVGLAKGGLKVRFSSTSPDNIEREAQRLRDMGLEEGRHFSVRMPEGSGEGYVSIYRKGLEHAAWLSVHSSERQRGLAAKFVEYILQRAKEKGEKVYEKASKIIEEGMSRGSLKLEGFEKEVEVNGKKHTVRVIGGGAEIEERQGGRKLLRIRITAEVDRARGNYTITYSRRGANNAAVGFAVVRADVPGGKEAVAERFAAVVEALTGKKPRVYRTKDGRVMIKCYEGHLEGFARFAELADAIEKWLEETGR
ncbi:MAG: hypothetical protein LM559_01595 [Pyrobaculum sp.]|nr:hypothetical protein [Pyrobaculum sp.]